MGQGWIDKQRDAQKTAAEIEIFPAAHFVDLKTRRPGKGFVDSSAARQVRPQLIAARVDFSFKWEFGRNFIGHGRAGRMLDF